MLSSAGATNVMLVTSRIPVTALLLGSIAFGEPVAGSALARHGAHRVQPPRDRSPPRCAVSRSPDPR
jgi:hypothetical protein